MSRAAERLYQRQIAASTRTDGTIDFSQLSSLVTSAYAEAHDDRRRTEHIAVVMAAEIEQANIALEHSVADLQAQNLRFTIALDNLANGVALFDRDARLVICNRRQREILSLRDDQVPAGCTLLAYLSASPLLSEDMIQQRIQLAEAGIETDFQQTLLNDREVRVVLRRIPDGGFLTTCEDVTERTRAAARIVHLAYHDPLTDLPNRTLLRDRFEQALKDGRCAVLCLDLDGFKRVNDTLGHTIGDMLLRAVSARLRRNLRGDETLARLGGDEFAVVIVGGMEEASIVAAQIIELVSARFEIDGHAINISTSIGIGVAPADGQTPAELLRHADIALYRAKASGRGCYRVFEPKMGTDASLSRREADLAPSRLAELTTV